MCISLVYIVLKCAVQKNICTKSDNLNKRFPILQRCLVWLIIASVLAEEVVKTGFCKEFCLF
jgi:hypothetical protein